MELPAALRQGVDRMLEGVPLPDLKKAARTLSDRYRAETRDGRLHMGSDMAAKAYLATRLPATYAAVRAALEAVAEARPDFSPKTLLDIGAGPGTMLWAAADRWPGLEEAMLLEASEPARKIGKTLADAMSAKVEWIPGDATLDLDGIKSADLVTVAYVLDELAPAALPKLVERLWALAGETLIIVEPGTPAGWQRILAARTQLVEAGGHIAAPCPHHGSCPLVEPDWCHFSRRVTRSRLHRLAKDAEVPWEDEKFAYVAVSHRPMASGTALPARVLAPPRAGSGKVELKLCRPDGSAGTQLFSRRDGDTFRAARRCDWGDTLPPG
ncbi:small ribosomal subunit Rsm22 family protein [Mesorhizobium sp. PUT5]|uniref:small ribosomal subunit Rsm22 family protein n=1 Tax=Mesorhizobium sp. PUT5 TaxID=3454629 RepID=UPI003FA470EC